MASIRKHGNNWQARVTRKGYPPETRTFANRTDAERWGRSIESEIDKGSYTSRTAAERVTLAEIIDRYIVEVSPTKRGGYEEIIRLKAMKRYRFAKFSMAALTAKVVAEYRDERLKTCKANTVVRDLGMLSSMINHCRREWGIAITNPVSQIRKPSMPPGRDRVLSAEEKTRLLAALVPTGRRNPYIRPLAQLALETAMRRSELLGLRWKDIDLTKRVAFLPLTKNGTERNVPLSSEAVAILQGMPRSIDGRVFPINIAAMEAAFLRGVRRAGLHGLHFHDLRHTAATNLAEKLTNILELSAVTGHKELRMLKRYYHPKAEDIARKLG
jgi:integrase